MNFQLIKIFYPDRYDNEYIQQFETSLITQIKNDFLTKLDLCENLRDGFVFYARGKDVVYGSDSTFSELKVKKDKKDLYFLVTIDIADGIIEDYPGYSTISYEESKDFRIESFEYDDEICPIKIRLSCDLTNNNHRICIGLLENFIIFTCKIQNHYKTGRATAEQIDSLSREYVFSRRDDFRTEGKTRTIDSMEKELNELEYLLSTIGFSVHKLLAVNNHMSLDFENTSKIFSQLHDKYGLTFSLGFLERKIKEIEYKANDSQFFLRVLQNNNDILLERLTIEENRQMMEFNRQMIELNADTLVIQNAAKEISLFIVFQVVMECMTNIVPNYQSAGIILKIGIPVLISLGVFFVIEIIEILCSIYNKKKSLALDKIMGEESKRKIVLFGLLTIFSFIIVYFLISQI